MTQKTSQKNLSPFGEAALALDQGFYELQELGGQLERLSFDSENGLDRARLLLVKFSACGQEVGEGLQKMASTLNEQRSLAEKTAAMVSERATMIQERQRETERMLVRFQALGEAFKKITSDISTLQKPAGESLSEAERSRLLDHLPQLDSELATLSGDATQLRSDAQAAQMKALEKNADALAQSLTSMRKRLSGFIETRPTVH